MKGIKDVQVDEKEMTRVEAIIDSMTAKERRNHMLINGSRRRRIARGSGTTVQQVTGTETVRAGAEDDAELLRRRSWASGWARSSRR